MSAARTIARYLYDVAEVIKIKQTLLLLASMYAAFIVAGGSGKPLVEHVYVLLLGFSSIASVTAVNMYFDMDIDALMERTRFRPLPAGRLSPRVVLYISLLVFTLSTYAGYRLVNSYFAGSMVVGFIFDIIAYTLLLKRRTPLNIIAGAVAGGAPAIGGWAAAVGTVDSSAILFSLIVIAWIPAHIWFLATYYKDDYRRASVPMLPAVSDDPYGVAAGVGLGSLVIGYAVLGLAANKAIGPASLAIGVAFSVYVFLAAMRYAESRGDPSLARKLFIRVNMGLAITLIVMMAEKVLGHII